MKAAAIQVKRQAQKSDEVFYNGRGVTFRVPHKMGFSFKRNVLLCNFYILCYICIDDKTKTGSESQRKSKAKSFCSLGGTAAGW